MEIGFEKSLSGIFVDLDLDIATTEIDDDERRRLSSIDHRRRSGSYYSGDDSIAVEGTVYDEQYAHFFGSRQYISALSILLNESFDCTRKIILEGGPGQGKSTVTQMVAQIYRQSVLQKTDLISENRWKQPQKVRMPLRVELRQFAEWIGTKSESSVEEYLASTLKRDSGGSEITVQDIHSLIEFSLIMFIFDGLDEVGSDILRDEVIEKISDFVRRTEVDLKSDIRVIVTTRPPAIAGRREKLIDFRRYTLAPLENNRIQEYVDRWLKVQLHDDYDRERVKTLFESRRKEPYVQALARNPMQLAVLLNFIRLTSDAFPDRRAELYRDYFKIVIDRDVAKYEALRKKREIIEALHQFLGFQIHILTEAQQADGSIGREQLLSMVQLWLDTQSTEAGTAQELFKLGEERLGLIVTLKGEGKDEKYGFTIQPVREYFAAAYVNEQYQGNAHEVFELMIRRTYWREVALFLAGLRRPNEKADLIIRARALDTDEEFGWRQHGRIIISQLLQEGVFSQPSHILTEATDFALDRLDPDVVPVQPESEPTTNVLVSILRKNKDKRHRDRLATLLNKYHNIDDDYILQRIYSVVSRLPELKHLLMEFLLQPESEEQAIIKKRLSWPLLYGVEVDKIAREDRYWAGVSEVAWASAIWRSAITNTSVINLPIPANLHGHLIEQISIGPILFADVTFQSQILRSNEVNSNYAVWVLLRLFRVISVLAEAYKLFSSPVMLDPNEGSDFLAKELEVNYEGVSDSSRDVIEDVIEILHRVARSFTQDINSITNESNSAIEHLVKYLDLPGPISWLVCRALILVVRSLVLVENGGMRRLRGEQLDSLLGYIDRNITLKDAVRQMSVFYKTGKNEPEVDFVRDILSFGFRRMMFDSTPLYFRDSVGGNLKGVVNAIVEEIKGESSCPTWVKNIPLTDHMLRDIFTSYKGEAENIIQFFSDSNFMFTGYGASLLTSDLQRVIKFARVTDDKNLLRNIYFALSTSKYVKTAGKELLLKFFKIGGLPRRYSLLLFNKRHRLQGEVDIDELQILDDVANEILRRPQEFPFSTRCAAADYLIERLPLNLPPLLDAQNVLF